MMLIIVGWVAVFALIAWLICGVFSLLAGGLLWPLGDSDEN